MKNLETVIYVSWEESERGWGCRPDGCSLHLSEKDYQSFEREYWDRMPEAVPDEYSRPAGKPVEVQVAQNLYQKIQGSTNGIRLGECQENEAAANKTIRYGKQRSGWVSRKSRDKK